MKGELKMMQTHATNQMEDRPTADEMTGELPTTDCDVCGEEMPDYAHGPHVCSTECRDELNAARGDRR